MSNPFPSANEVLVLQLLRDAPGGVYGLELVKMSGGKLGRGGVYVTLGRMEEKGFIRSRTPAAADHPGGSAAGGGGVAEAGG